MGKQRRSWNAEEKLAAVWVVLSERQSRAATSSANRAKDDTLNSFEAAVGYTCAERVLTAYAGRPR